MRRVATLLTLVVALLTACAAGEPVSPTPQPVTMGNGAIEGCVRLAPDDRPIKADLDVRDAQGNTMPRLQNKPTNRSGCYSIKRLDEGTYTIDASARVDGGLATGSAVVEVRHATTARADITVTRTADAP